MAFKINDFVYCTIYKGEIFKITRMDNKSYFCCYIKSIKELQKQMPKYCGWASAKELRKVPKIVQCLLT